MVALTNRPEIPTPALKAIEGRGETWPKQDKWVPRPSVIQAFFFPKKSKTLWGIPDLIGLFSIIMKLKEKEELKLCHLPSDSPCSIRPCPAAAVRSSAGALQPLGVFKKRHLNVTGFCPRHLDGLSEAFDVCPAVGRWRVSLAARERLSRAVQPSRRPSPVCDTQRGVCGVCDPVPERPVCFGDRPLVGVSSQRCQ